MSFHQSIANSPLPCSAQSQEHITANSGRKRANAIPQSLYRPVPSPSRAAKMVDVWRNAAVSLERSNIAKTPRPAFRIIEERQDFALSQWSGRYGPGGDDTRDMLSFTGDDGSGTIATPLEVRHGQVYPTPGPYLSTSSEGQSLQLSTPEGAGTTQQQAKPGAIEYPVLDTSSIREEQQPLLQGPQAPTHDRRPLQPLFDRSRRSDDREQDDDDDDCHSSHGVPLIMPYANPNGLLQPTTQKAQIDFWIDDVVAQTEHHPAFADSSSKQSAPMAIDIDPAKPTRPPKSRPLPKIPASSAYTTPPKRGSSFLAKELSKQELSKSPLREISSTSSNKENVAPKSATPSPTKIPLPASTAPPRRMPGSTFATSPLANRGNGDGVKGRATHTGKENEVPVEDVPTGSTTSNARKLIQTLMSVGQSPKKASPYKAGGKAVGEVRDADAQLPDLSPSVAVQRKGKRAGMKRERSMHRWDEDILVKKEKCEVLDFDGDVNMRG